MKYLLFIFKILFLFFLYSCSSIYIDIPVSEEKVDIEVEDDGQEKKIEKPQKEEITSVVKETKGSVSESSKAKKIKEEEKSQDTSNIENNLNDKDLINSEEQYLKGTSFNKKVKIGLLIPLSGKNAYLGESIYKSSEMALFETKSDHIELIPNDSGSTLESAVEAAMNLEKAGVSMIIGPIFSSQAKAVRNNISKTIPIFSFTNDEKSAERGLWAFGFSPQQEIKAIFKEIKTHLIANMAMIIPNSAYGNVALESILRESSFYNIKIKNIYRYAIASENFSALGEEFKRSKSLDFDALLILAGGKQLREIASRAQYRGISPKDIKYFGISSWNDPDILGEPALLGGIFVAPQQSSFESFVSRYYKVYGINPIEISALSYDILSLCATGLKEAKDIQEFLHFLTKKAGFNGVFGYFSLEENGKINRKFISYKVLKRSFVKRNLNN